MQIDPNDTTQSDSHENLFVPQPTTRDGRSDIPTEKLQNWPKSYEKNKPKTNMLKRRRESIVIKCKECRFVCTGQVSISAMSQEFQSQTTGCLIDLVSNKDLVKVISSRSGSFKTNFFQSDHLSQSL